jgi:hypothetical protein
MRNELMHGASLQVSLMDVTMYLLSLSKFGTNMSQEKRMQLKMNWLVLRVYNNWNHAVDITLSLIRQYIYKYKS